MKRIALMCALALGFLLTLGGSDALAKERPCLAEKEAWKASKIEVREEKRTATRAKKEYDKSQKSINKDRLKYDKKIAAKEGQLERTESIITSKSLFSGLGGKLGDAIGTDWGGFVGAMTCEQKLAKLCAKRDQLRVEIESLKDQRSRMAQSSTANSDRAQALMATSSAAYEAAVAVENAKEDAYLNCMNSAKV